MSYQCDHTRPSSNRHHGRLIDRWGLFRDRSEVGSCNIPHKRRNAAPGLLGSLPMEKSQRHPMNSCAFRVWVSRLWAWWSVLNAPRRPRLHTQIGHRAWKEERKSQRDKKARSLKSSWNPIDHERSWTRRTKPKSIYNKPIIRRFWADVTFDEVCRSGRALSKTRFLNFRIECWKFDWKCVPD